MGAFVEPQSFIERFVAAAIEDPRIQVVWVEAASVGELRGGIGSLDLHLAVYDPDLEAVFAAHAELLGKGAAVLRHADAEADFEGKVCRAEASVGGERREVVLTVERMSLVGKRPRRAILPLHDRTGHFRHVLSRAL